ncbi:serine hydrolase domain-containing protein [candidate division KSB1 bacterium]
MLRKNYPGLLLFLFTTTAFSFCSCVNDLKLSPEANEAIENFSQKVAQDIAEDDIGCITAAVVKNGEVVWSKGFGLADKENNIPAEPVTIGRTGSISKSFTAVLMMALVEKGVILLDDPVYKYLPEINQLKDKPDGAVPITFRHLASHTAGLIREPGLEGAASGPIGEWTQQILRSIPTTSYQSLPGEKYSYSNIGFGMLGYALERAAGMPFMQMMKEYIFNPLGMENTTFIISEDQKEILSKGYAVRRDGTVDAEQPFLEHNGRGYKIPNGGIYSNVIDQAKFIGAMTGIEKYRILSDESLEQIHSVQNRSASGGEIQTPDNNETKYGLGFFIYEYPDDGITLTGHSGSVSGYNAFLVYDRESKLGVVMFRNYSRGKTNLNRDARALLVELIKIEKSGL